MLSLQISIVWTLMNQRCSNFQSLEGVALCYRNHFEVSLSFFFIVSAVALV